MERFCLIANITAHELEKLNEARMYMRVITIADLADATDTTILDGMLNGDFQAGSDLVWPNTPQPPKSFFAFF